MDESFAYDPFSFAVHADPWTWYRRLRADFPVYHNDERGFWALSRFHDVQAAGRDWRTFSSVQRALNSTGRRISTPSCSGRAISSISIPKRHDRLGESSA